MAFTHMVCEFPIKLLYPTHHIQENAGNMRKGQSQKNIKNEFYNVVTSII
jgi:hypothetical protein